MNREQIFQLAQKIQLQFNPELLSPFPYQHILQVHTDVKIFLLDLDNGISGVIKYDQKVNEFHIFIDRKKIGFSTDLQTFENAVAASFATIELEQNCDIEAIWSGVCNDVFQQPDCPSVHWTLTKGKLSFKVNKVPTLPQCNDFYLATVILENAEFQKDNSTETQTFDKIEFKNVQVGWCAG